MEFAYSCNANSYKLPLRTTLEIIVWKLNQFCVTVQLPAVSFEGTNCDLAYVSSAGCLGWMSLAVSAT